MQPNNSFIGNITSYLNDSFHALVDYSLHIAARHGYTMSVIALIKAGANVNADDTPLLLAAEKGHAETVTALLNAGANVHAKNSLGETPLHLAARHGRTEAVTALLSLGANIHATNNYGSTPLHWAAMQGNSETVTVLLNAGAELDRTDIDDRTPLHVAAVQGNSETVTVLLNAGAELDRTDIDGKTPLHAAAKHGNTKTVTALLSLGANIHTTNNNGSTALHEAAKSRNVETITVLLSASANIHATNSRGDMPLHVAASYGRTENVTALLSAGANIHATNNNGSTPLHRAAEQRNSDTVTDLLNAGAELDRTDIDGKTPLHVAARYGRTENVTALLNARANINARNSRGNTPLHTAAWNGRTEIVTALLNAGANFNANNIAGNTPIIAAFENGHHHIVQLLQARGAVLPAHLAQQLPNVQVNPQQSTHTQSVHESLAVAASALYQKYMHFDFHLMADFNEAHAKKSHTKKLYLESDGAYLLTNIDGNIDRKGFIPQEAGFNLNNLSETLHEPSFQQAVLKATGILDSEAILSEINRFAETLDEKDLVEGAAKRCLARLPSIDFTERRSNVTLYQALICVWLGLHDAHAIQGKTLTPEDITARRKTFVQHLYQMQRGYNLNQQGIDNQGDDKIICIPGHFNQLIDTLNGGHDLVATVMVNAGTVSLKAVALANEAFLTLEQATQTQYAPLWTKEEGVPEELLTRLQAAIEKSLRAEFDAFKHHHDFEAWIGAALSADVLGCVPPPKSVVALQEKILAERKTTEKRPANEPEDKPAPEAEEDQAPSPKRRRLG